jgi:hypothetical protein
MKGIAHFSVGVAAASCLPGTVESAATGNPLYFLLGGIFGLLPDTLDFRILRFLYPHDIEAVLDPLSPDPNVVANAVAIAVSQTRETGRPVRLKLATVRMAADEWLRYHVRFDRTARKVRVQLGPVVSTGGEPIRDLVHTPHPREASHPLPADVRIEYTAETVVDIFDGPAFEFVPEGHTVTARFITWHRSWSHGLLCAAAGALLCWLWFDARAAMVAAVSSLAHGLADQLGQMGNNWFYPFRKHRVPGWRTMRSGDGLANLATVWGACLVLFWNLARPAAFPHPFSMGRLFLWGWLMPLALAVLLKRILDRRSASP